MEKKRSGGGVWFERIKAICGKKKGKPKLSSSVPATNSGLACRKAIGANATDTKASAGSTLCHSMNRVFSVPIGRTRYPARAKSSRYIHAIAMKCGNCQVKTIA